MFLRMRLYLKALCRHEAKGLCSGNSELSLSQPSSVLFGWPSTISYLNVSWQGLHCLVCPRPPTTCSLRLASLSYVYLCGWPGLRWCQSSHSQLEASGALWETTQLALIWSTPLAGILACPSTQQAASASCPPTPATLQCPAPQPPGSESRSGPQVLPPATAYDTLLSWALKWLHYFPFFHLEILPSLPQAGPLPQSAPCLCSPDLKEYLTTC